MNGPCDPPVRAGSAHAAGLLKRPLWQMDTVGTDLLGQFGIESDQQESVAAARGLAQSQGGVTGVGRTEMTIDHARAEGQARRRLPGPAGAQAVGEEQQGRRTAAGPAFTPADFGGGPCEDAGDLPQDFGV